VLELMAGASDSHAEEIPEKISRGDAETRREKDGIG
jgi:hypothetical protein